MKNIIPLLLTLLWSTAWSQETTKVTPKTGRRARRNLHRTDQHRRRLPATSGCWSNNFKDCNHPLWAGETCNQVWLPDGPSEDCEAPLWGHCDESNRCCGNAKCQLAGVTAVPMEDDYYYAADDMSYYNYDDNDDDMNYYYDDDDMPYNNTYAGDDYYGFDDDYYGDDDDGNWMTQDDDWPYSYYYGYDDLMPYYMYVDSAEEMPSGQCVPEGDYIETAAPTPTPTVNPTKNPTDSPTKNPTDSPTKSPTDFPTKHPIETPTIPVNAPACVDSGGGITVNGSDKTCKWIGNRVARRINNCKKSIVKSFCPKTCGICCEDALGTFEWKPDRMKDCQFARDNAWPCNQNLFKEHCPVTCDACIPP